VNDLSSPLRAPALSDQLERELEDLYVRGTPENTLRAYERDLVYISAWKLYALGEPLVWPEDEKTALRFVLDHARDLNDAPSDDAARQTASAMISVGLRRKLDCPAPSTLVLRHHWCAKPAPKHGARMRGHAHQSRNIL